MAKDVENGNGNDGSNHSDADDYDHDDANPLRRMTNLSQSHAWDCELFCFNLGGVNPVVE